uniref:Cholecystokinin n=1 Tax=Danio rerio TaxID=7955 RepID=A0A0R4IHW0_DANRE|nr:cholecystokinin [Danio rerio]|eukprot:XP_002665661.2 cholecystokinin [Danio rerio]
MNSGVCVCVILAALSVSVSCASRPVSDERSLSARRLARSASLTLQQPLPPAGDIQPDTRANLSQLLAKLISSKKGSVRRNSSMNSRANSVNHRIKDRDYVGWMDFGRRSAEEYEYSS